MPAAGPVDRADGGTDEPVGRSPIEVYYNSVCPVCRGGVEMEKRALARHSATDAAAFTDVSCQMGALVADGVTLDMVRRHLYVRDTAGVLHRGADTVAVLWSASPGRRWLGRLLMTPGIRGIARFGYDRFADLLYAWNRRSGRW